MERNPIVTKCDRDHSNRDEVLDLLGPVQDTFQVLELTGWRIRGGDGAAEILGLKPSTLEFRVVKLGIRRPSPSEVAG
jgi:hypothetical protein